MQCHGCDSSTLPWHVLIGWCCCASGCLFAAAAVPGNALGGLTSGMSVHLQPARTFGTAGAVGVQRERVSGVARRGARGLPGHHGHRGRAHPGQTGGRRGERVRRTSRDPLPALTASASLTVHCAGWSPAASCCSNRDWSWCSLRASATCSPCMTRQSSAKLNGSYWTTTFAAMGQI